MSNPPHITFCEEMLRSELCAGVDMSPNNSFKIVRLEDLPDPHEILSEKEFSKYNSFKVEKRKREWLGGRFAAKSAITQVTSHKSQVTSEELRTIEITCDKYGRPIWQETGAQEHRQQNTDNRTQVPATSTLHPTPYTLYPIPYLLSISHSGEYAVAVAKNKKCSFLGIDIEKIEQRHPLWAKDYFHKIEIIKNTPEFLTELWTKKEAILKALGLGLKADPFDIIIMNKINPVKSRCAGVPTIHRDNFTGVKFLNKALLRYKELGEPDFTIKVTKLKDYIISLVIEQI